MQAFQGFALMVRVQAIGIDSLCSPSAMPCLGSSPNLALSTGPINFLLAGPLPALGWET